MQTDLQSLLILAASTGFIHTLAGPDHYLPFIVLSKARNWSQTKTLWVTFTCGVGHVLSSIAVGSIGIGLGFAVDHLSEFESNRGSYAAKGLVIFGALYLAWGIYKAILNKPHKHAHIHDDGIIHNHQHSQENQHQHEHKKDKWKKLTPWVLFILFILGPCEVLIPQLMVPAIDKSLFGIIAIITIFAISTITTMMIIVVLTLKGISVTNLKKLERYTHALAGMAVLMCGLAITVLGL